MVKPISYESLDKKDVDLALSTKRRIDSTVEILISDLKFLEETLGLYKDALNENVSSSLVSADIVSKYRNADTNGAYNLPGVFAGTAGSYNLMDMKKDNEKLRQTQEVEKSSEDRREASYNNISKVYSDIRSRLNLLAQDNQQLFQFIEQLKEKV